MTSIEVALDWSPNTLHAGFLVAQHKGWYKDAGLKVKFINPEDDDYTITPAKRLANKNAHFAIAPTESILSYRNLPTSIPLVAVSALVQEDTSAIVTLASSGLERPKDLDGKVYASYAARFEDCIVKKMIQNDHGFGMLQVSNPEKFGIWNALLHGDADATWVFMPWEGVQAEQKNIELNAFKLGDYGIPYGYSPLLLSHEEFLEENPESVALFLEVSARGHEFVDSNPEGAAAYLCEHELHANFYDYKFIKKSLEGMQGKWLNSKGWGYMDKKVWDDFTNWLLTNKVLCDIEGEHLEALKSDMANYYTNSFLKKSALINKPNLV